MSSEVYVRWLRMWPLARSLAPYKMQRHGYQNFGKGKCQRTKHCNLEGGAKASQELMMNRID
jgi:hypothetical protein